MSDYEPIKLNAFFRANHSTLWELADKSGVLASLNMTLESLDACPSSNLAEDAIFGGKVDFVAGNHITPYYWVTQGKPIVCLASPSNSVKDRIVSRKPLASLEEFKGKSLRIADSYMLDSFGGYQHPRGNHLLDIREAGFADEDVQWVEVDDLQAPDFRKKALAALNEGKADIAFSGGNPDDLAKEGFYILDLPTLPMVNGPTITTGYEALYKKDRLAERLVKAAVLTIHYAKMHPDEAQKLLDARLGKPYTERGGRATGAIGRLPMKPYPSTAAVANAYELCVMHHPGTETISPMALWDLHYLRDLDLSGFIDELVTEQDR